MNYWQIHVAARKRIKARRDILSLLKNSHPRQPKNKKKHSVTQKRCGIFANAISFKILREDGNEFGVELPPQSRGSAKAVHIERLKQTKRDKDLSVINQGFNVIETPKENHDVTIIPNFNNTQTKQVQLPGESRAERATVSPNETTCLNVLNEQHIHRASLSNHNTQKHQITTDHNENVIAEELLSNKSHAFTDFTFNNVPQTTELQHQMLSFDTLIDANLQNAPDISSINFNKFEEPIGADDCTSFTDTLGSSSNNSILSGFCSDCPSIFGIEVETTNTPSAKEMFEPRSSSHGNHDDQSLTTPTNGHQKLSPNQSLFESIEESHSDSSEGFGSFDPRVIKSSNMLRGSTLNGLRPQLTLNQLIARKSLAARRSYQRLFGQHPKLIA